MKKLLILSILSTTISLSALFSYTYQNAHKPATAHKQQLETYTYKLTKIDHTGFYRTSTNDNTHIYFVAANVPKGIELHINDLVKVSFPLNSYEIITKIEKIK